MIINKQVAIEAIETELKLLNGEFFSRYDEINASPKELKKCSVCAVGSILRAHCFTKLKNRFNIGRACNYEAGHANYEVHFDEDQDNYLGNLSMLFEYKSEIEYIDPNSDVMRMHLINYIECAWPDKFEVGVAE